MDSVISNLQSVLQAVISATSRFDETTWGVLAVATVVFGYFMLRGNLLR